MCLPTVSSHTSSAHLRSRKGREKRREEMERREEKERLSPEAWRLWRGTGGLAHCIFRGLFANLSRLFRGSFRKFGCPSANFLKVLQPCTVINECALLFQRFTNIHVMTVMTKKSFKNKTWPSPFATFREAILLSRSFATQHFPSQKCCRTSPWLKQSIDIFFVAHVPKCSRTNPCGNCGFVHMWEHDSSLPTMRDRGQRLISFAFTKLL